MWMPGEGRRAARTSGSPHPGVVFAHRRGEDQVDVDLAVEVRAHGPSAKSEWRARTRERYRAMAAQSNELHPKRAEDVTVGVLCDWSRSEQAEDPVEWDAFRTAVHESQVWVLHRLWT